MIPENRISNHPRKILLEEFLKPMGISRISFAKHIGVPARYIYGIVHGKREINANIAWRFSEAFGTTPEFWMSLKAAHDLVRN